MTATPIKSRDRDTILQALAAGVVPRTGFSTSRSAARGEVGALVRDIDRIADGGSAIRFVIGEYGAGKTFFLNLVRLIALERKCVTIHADLAPDRRLHATGGQARGLYAEAVRNMATRTKPEGGALASVVERFVTECVRDGASSRGSGRAGHRRAAGAAAGACRRLRLCGRPEGLLARQRGRRRGR